MVIKDLLMNLIMTMKRLLNLLEKVELTLPIV